MSKDLVAKTIQVLEEASMPVSIDYVAHQIGVGWGTARGILLLLALEGKIRGEKTTKSWIFRLHRTAVYQKGLTGGT